MASSLLHQMTLEFPTQFWNDSCEVESLREAIAQGATGATSNPVIVMAAIEKDRPRWEALARELVKTHPTETEVQLAWRLVDRAAIEGAALLQPVFDQHAGSAGRLSLQVNPQYWPDAAAMTEQAMHFATLAPNMAVKVPAVAAGLDAIEELTARGVVINATVSYSVPQALAVAEAVERGFKRMKPDVDPQVVTPWVTIMVGRIDDHLRDEAKENGITIDPEIVRQASTAIFRRAYGLFQERGYRSTLLSAAMRSHHHWSEFIGGDCVITIPPGWQTKFNDSGVELKARMHEPVESAVTEELAAAFPDFVRAYEPEGMSPQDFAAFGPCRKTLRQFLGGYDTLVGFARAIMLEGSL